MRHFYPKVILFPALFAVLLAAMMRFNYRQAPLSSTVVASDDETHQQLDPTQARKQQIGAQLFDRAQIEFNRGNVNEAIKIGLTIPSDVPAAKQFQAVVKNWSRNQSILDLAKKFQDQGEDSLAIALLRNLAPAVRSSKTVRNLEQQLLSRQSSPATVAQLASPNKERVAPVAPSSTEQADPSQIVTTDAQSQSESDSPSEPKDNSRSTESETPQTNSGHQSWYTAASERDTSSEPYRTKSLKRAGIVPQASRPSFTSGNGDSPTRDFSGFSN